MEFWDDPNMVLAKLRQACKDYSNSSNADDRIRATATMHDAIVWMDQVFTDGGGELPADWGRRLVPSVMEKRGVVPDVVYQVPECPEHGYGTGLMTISVYCVERAPLGARIHSEWLVEVHHEGTLLISWTWPTGVANTHLEVAARAAYLTTCEDEQTGFIWPFSQRLYHWADQCTAIDIL